MNCNRCTGMMVVEMVSTRQGKIEMARCLYCGNLIDPLVIKNRGRSKAALNTMLEREAIEEEKRPLQKVGLVSFSKPARHVDAA